MVTINDVLAGRYRVVRKLGVGGMGTVYLAEHIHLKRPTAVKVLRGDLHTDAEAEARFRREAMLAARITHPHVAQVFDFDRTPQGEFVLAMEFVEGETVAERLGRHGAFDLSDALNILLAVADGLDRAHSLGILHRDIKPQNIMLGPGGVVKLLDFGVARDLDTSSITSGGMAVGTPAYMSPEQLMGEPLTPATDTYALGTVFYEMLTGRLPHSGTTVAKLRAERITQAGTPLVKLKPEYPRALSEAVSRSVHPEPKQRWPSAGAFARAAVERAERQIPAPPRAAGVREGAADQLERWEGHFEALRFAGRDRDIRSVRDAWAAARAGRATVLFVEGDEGAGKSAFFELARREAATDGAARIVGRGYDVDVSQPYGPWIPILRQALQLQAAQSRTWPAISSLTDARPETAVPTRAVLFDQVAALVHAVASHSPLFLGMEDIDSCDSASLALFEFLACNLSGVSLLLACTADVARVQAESLARQMRERLRRLGNVTWIRLHPLGYDAIVSWLGRGLADEPPEALIRFVYGHTEGNAFFIEQVVRSLVEQGEIDQLSEEQVRVALAHSPPPEAVADVVRRRLNAMSDAARDVLQIAAVVGREFDVDLIVELSQHSEDAVLDALDEAVTAGVLTSTQSSAGDWYRFAHGKFGQVHAQSMNPRRKRRLHAAIAEALLARLDTQSGAVAWHYYQAGDRERCFRHARAAARNALALRDYDDALTFGVMAAEVAEADADERESHELRGDALRGLDRQGEAAAAYAHARLADETVGRVTLRCKELLSALAAGAVHPGTAAAEIGELAEQAGSLPPEEQLLADLVLAHALLAAGQTEGALTSAGQARARAAEVKNPALEGDALLTAGRAHVRDESWPAARSLAQEARAVFKESGDAHGMARAAMLEAMVAEGTGDLAAADEALTDAMTQAERVRIPGLLEQISERRVRLLER